MSESEPTDSEVVILPKGLQAGIDCYMVVDRSVFDKLVIDARTQEPGFEAILVSVGRAKNYSDSVWKSLLANDAIVDRYTTLCNEMTEKMLNALEKKQCNFPVAAGLPLSSEPRTTIPAWRRELEYVPPAALVETPTDENDGEIAAEPTSSDEVNEIIGGNVEPEAGATEDTPGVSSEAPAIGVEEVVEKLQDTGEATDTRTDLLQIPDEGLGVEASIPGDSINVGLTGDEDTDNADDAASTFVPPESAESLFVPPENAEVAFVPPDGDANAFVPPESTGAGDASVTPANNLTNMDGNEEDVGGEEQSDDATPPAAPVPSGISDAELEDLLDRVTEVDHLGETSASTPSESVIEEELSTPPQVDDGDDDDDNISLRDIMRSAPSVGDGAQSASTANTELSEDAKQEEQPSDDVPADVEDARQEEQSSDNVPEGVEDTEAPGVLEKPDEDGVSDEEDIQSSLDRYNEVRSAILNIIGDANEVFNTYGCDRVCALMNTTFEDVMHATARAGGTSVGKLLTECELSSDDPAYVGDMLTALLDDCITYLEGGEYDAVDTVLDPLMRLIYKE